jgi:hypothetical protein
VSTIPHLSLAETCRSRYGVAGDEVASPSSSILYPFLLAGDAWPGSRYDGPFVLNVIGSGAADDLGFFWDAFGKMRRDAYRF